MRPWSADVRPNGRHGGTHAELSRFIRGSAHPNAVFLPPDFTRYRAVSRQVREIFKRHTDLIEPLSFDEAYLDVSGNKTGLPTATQVARTIRGQIRTELNLTTSAGVAKQIPREDCFGLEKTGWTLCDTTGRNRFVSIAAAR